MVQVLRAKFHMGLCNKESQGYTLDPEPQHYESQGYTLDPEPQHYDSRLGLGAYPLLSQWCQTTRRARKPFTSLPKLRLQDLAEGHAKHVRGTPGPLPHPKLHPQPHG